VPDERAELCDDNRTRDMTIDVVAHLARLPGEQVSFPARNLMPDSRIDLLSQQRRDPQYRGLGRLFLIGKLTNRRIQQS
jgi:hypothetical protein